VHTSARVRLTSVVMWICIQVWIPDPDRHQNLIICSSAHCQPSLKVFCDGSFCAKLLTNRQTNNDENITYLTQVITMSHMLSQFLFICPFLELLQTENRIFWDNWSRVLHTSCHISLEYFWINTRLILIIIVLR